MTQAFKRAIMSTDWHYGLRHNNRQHNQDVEDFLKWQIDLAHKNQCETCFFLGDYHHHRASVNVSTLNYMVSGLRLLNDNFEKVYFIVGNHDLFYREKREIHSLPMAQEFSRIKIVDEPLFENQIAVLPWLVGDEWKKLDGLDQVQYVFGHFELPRFKMNAMVEMPDHGGLNASHLAHAKYVFSGHFHKRQQRDNVIYIGNPFGHNYADSWDFERGCTMLEWNGEPQFINYNQGPRYITTTLSELIDRADQYLLPKTHARVMLDIDISYEEANFLRETFLEKYQIRELKLVNPAVNQTQDSEPAELDFQTVDQTVVAELSALESDTYNIQTLIDLYQNA